MPDGDSKRKSGCSDTGSIAGSDDAGASEPDSCATLAELRSLVHEQDYKCALSGRLLDPDEAHIDHVVPLSSGGCDRIENLQWLCKNVNRAKSTLSNEEFHQLCWDVVETLGPL